MDAENSSGAAHSRRSLLLRRRGNFGKARQGAGSRDLPPSRLLLRSRPLAGRLARPLDSRRLQALAGLHSGALLSRSRRLPHGIPGRGEELERAPSDRFRRRAQYQPDGPRRRHLALCDLSRAADHARRLRAGQGPAGKQRPPGPPHDRVHASGSSPGVNREFRRGFLCFRVRRLGPPFHRPGPELELGIRRIAGTWSSCPAPGVSVADRAAELCGRAAQWQAGTAGLLFSGRAGIPHGLRRRRSKLVAGGKDCRERRRARVRKRDGGPRNQARASWSHSSESTGIWSRAVPATPAAPGAVRNGTRCGATPTRRWPCRAGASCWPMATAENPSASGRACSTPSAAASTRPEEFVLREDGGRSDLGYPLGCLLPDGNALITYYFNDRRDGGTQRYIAGTLVAER